MSDVANDLSVRPELDKLRALLPLDARTCQQLGQHLNARQLCTLRYDVLEQHHRYRRHQFTGLARLLRLLPAAWLARWSLRAGAAFTGRVLVAMDVLTSRQVARRMDPVFLADVTREADPGVVRPLIEHLPPDLIRDVAVTLIDNGDYIVAGQLADSLTTPAIREVVAAVTDNAQLIRVAYYMDDTQRLGDIIRMIDNDRLTRIIASGTVEPELWPCLLWIIDHVSRELKSRLSNIMVQRDPETLNALVRVAHEQQLWGPVLRSISTLQRRHMRAVVHLDALRDETVLAGLIQAAYAENALNTTLPLVDAMNRDLQRIVAHTGLKQGADVAEAFIRATIEEHLPALLLTLSERLTDEEKRELSTLPVLADPSVLKAITTAALSTGRISTLFRFVQFLSEKAQEQILSIIADDDAELFERVLNSLDPSQVTDWNHVARLLHRIRGESELASISSVLRYQTRSSRDILKRVLTTGDEAMPSMSDRLGL